MFRETPINPDLRPTSLFIITCLGKWNTYQFMQIKVERHLLTMSIIQVHYDDWNSENDLKQMKTRTLVPSDNFKEWFEHNYDIASMLQLLQDWECIW